MKKCFITSGPGPLMYSQWDSSSPRAATDCSDQTGRIPRQFRVFTGCTDHLNGFIITVLYDILGNPGVILFVPTAECSGHGMDHALVTEDFEYACILLY